MAYFLQTGFVYLLKSISNKKIDHFIKNVFVLRKTLFNNRNLHYNDYSKLYFCLNNNKQIKVL